MHLEMCHCYAKHFSCTVCTVCTLWYCRYPLHRLLCWLVSRRHQRAVHVTAPSQNCSHSTNTCTRYTREATTLTLTAYFVINVMNTTQKLISLNIFNCLIFIVEMKCVFCEYGNGFSSVIYEGMSCNLIISWKDMKRKVSGVP
jgi:hypothetical protein